MDAVVVADVVAVVQVRRRVDRHRPDAVHAELADVVEAIDESDEIARAVAVAVTERLDVKAVDDGVLPPHVAGGRPLPPRLVRRSGHRSARRSTTASLVTGPAIPGGASLDSVDRRGGCHRS